MPESTGLSWLITGASGRAVAAGDVEAAAGVAWEMAHEDDAVQVRPVGSEVA